MTEYPIDLNLEAFETWLSATHPELHTGTQLTAQLLTGGRSNLTYRVDGATIPLVVRRPPLGHVLTTAHDMSREARVLRALQPTEVPVPTVVDLVADPNPIAGAAFYVMHHVEGDTLTSKSQNRDFSSSQLNRLSLDLAVTLAELHRLNPQSIGLSGLGRPTGYLDRQLARWHQQLAQSGDRPLDTLRQLEGQLRESIPTGSRSGIVHGDYRLDNVIVTHTGATASIAAVVDWEMATLGDPLVDLGMLGIYWDIASLPGAADLMPSSVDQRTGYSSFDELVDAYALSARIATPELRWYRAFAAYKLAVIAEGINYRYVTGGAVGEGYTRVADIVIPLALEGQKLLGRLRNSDGNR